MQRSTDLPRLTPQAVMEFAQAHSTQGLCAACRPYASAGWISFPSTENDANLRPVGALWLPGDDEPSLEENRPAGLDGWSPLAPISLEHHPYNRCQVWVCTACNFPFLRYTEYGGYYEDKRIRELRADRLVQD
jgi:hypothetical protein